MYSESLLLAQVSDHLLCSSTVILGNLLLDHAWEGSRSVNANDCGDATSTTVSLCLNLVVRHPAMRKDILCLQRYVRFFERLVSLGRRHVNEATVWHINVMNTHEAAPVGCNHRRLDMLVDGVHVFVEIPAHVLNLSCRDNLIKNFHIIT